MYSWLFILCVVLVPALGSFFVAEKRDWMRLFIVMFLAGLFFLSFLWLVNESIPFTAGGDDKSYFEISKRTFKGFSDWFDLKQFKFVKEQPGYPLLLSWVHQFTGDSLFHRKALNVLLFLLLALVWFVIGKKIGGSHLAFVFVIGILLATPIWFYWFFLLKDIVIVLLQSLLILGLVNIMSGKLRVQGYGVVALSTVLLIPFRSLLAFANLAALASTTFLHPKSLRSAKGFLLKLLMALVMISCLLIIGQSSQFTQQFGVGGEGRRTLSYDAVQWQIKFFEKIRPNNLFKFTLSYLVGEIAAFNPKSWSGMSAYLMRGLLMLPWIYIGLPLFLMGVTMIFRKKKASVGNQGIAESNDASGFEAIAPDRAYLMLFLIFVLIYACVSFLSGDTTRYRLPSIPPMIAISGFAWVNMEKTRRFGILLGWGFFLSVFLVLYYGAFK
jgi:hypothetical protein